MVTSPIRYIGGKHYMAKYIVPIIEAYEHTTYVEPFGGAAHILLAKKPSTVEVYNDINDAVANFFRVVADAEMSQELLRLISIMPFSRKVFKESIHAVRHEKDCVKRAFALFAVSKQSFSGDTLSSSPSWGFAVKDEKQVKSWVNSTKNLVQAIERMRNVRVECRDFREVLHDYDKPDTLLYCDPPYVLSTRCRGYYKHEMSDDEHREFVNMMLRLSGAAIVSGHWHEIYYKLEKSGWARLDITVKCFSVKTRGSHNRPTRTEVLWIHPRIAEAVDVNGILARATGKKKSQER
ncbi:MAG: DNA adenine methylase [Candidatus Caldarchaeum sp.]